MVSPNRLLIIDDDHEIKTLFRIFAEALGYSVEQSEADQDLLETYDRLLPTVIMLDLAMPEKDGVEMLRELARRGCEAPIILTSGQSARVLAATKRLGSELGLNMPYSLTKPVSERDLRTVLTKTWNHSFTPSAEELEEAIKAGQMVVHFQAKIGLAQKGANSIVGSEALVRWQHPQRGLQPPGNFIPIAEEAGLIGLLTDAVLDNVIIQLQAWSERGLFLPVSVNLSPSQLTDLELPDRLADRLVETGLNPSLLTFEVTEQTVSPNKTTAIDILTRLRLKGFGVSLDDFGAGYSSIAEIYRLPLSEVKIDRSITFAAETDHDARKVVRAIVDLCHSFDLKVCAEGVETQKGALFLTSIGCEMAQGFYFAKPLPPAHFYQFVSKTIRAAADAKDLEEVA